MEFQMRTVTLIVCIGAASAVLTAGQSESSQQRQNAPQFRAGVDLMRIEATVLDKRTRKPVHGLTASDFIVKVNGEPQPIEVLDEVKVAGREASGGTPFLEAARDVASNTMVHPRLFLIVMDDAIASRDLFYRKKGKDIAHAVVDGLGPNDLAAVIFAQDNRNAQDFTADRPALRRAIETYDPKPLNPLMASLMSISVLERASSFLRRMPGYRRSIVWVTLGPSAEPQDDEQAAGWQLEPLQTVNVTGGEASESLSRTERRVLNGGIAAVPVYAYHLAGLRPVTVGETKGVAMPGPFGNEILDSLARSSGGRQIYNTNAPDLAVPSMFNELSAYYAIAFRANFPMDGKLRRLQVEVKRPDVIIAPPDTSFRTPKEMPAFRGTAARPAPTGLVEALSGPLPHGAVRLTLSAVAVAVSKRKEQSVALTLGIPTPPIDGVAKQFRLSLLVYDPEGLREILKQDQTVTVTARRDERHDVSEVTLPLSLLPGRYLVRVGVAEVGADSTGSVYTTITVPNFAKEPLSLSGVAVGWAEGRPIGGRESLVSILPFAPTTVREFATTDHVGALLRVHQPPGRPSAVQMETQVLNADEAVVVSETRAIAASAFTPDTGVEHRYELPLKTLAPGEYLLRFSATAAGRTVTRDVRFVIR
jgi:VWFA-related protein